MNKKRFIAQQGSSSTVKVFTAETGQLYRVIDVGGTITSPPVCTENELTVGVRVSNDTLLLKIYSIPTFSLKKTVNV